MSANTLTIVFFGDIVGRPGREGVIKALPKIREQHAPDLVLANVENLAHGFGITEQSINELKDAGVDLCTSGNHVWDKQGPADAILTHPDPFVLRPANYGDEPTGVGYKTVQIGKADVLVINLQGRVFMPHEVENPFHALEHVLSQAGPKHHAVFIDFHAEATSEKVGLGQAFDGRVSAIVGTHTHVATADARVLPGGTAYQTDVGMCGSTNGVIGMNKEKAVARFYGEEDARLEPAEESVAVHATVITISLQTTRAVSIQSLRVDIPKG